MDNYEFPSDQITDWSSPSPSPLAGADWSYSYPTADVTPQTYPADEDYPSGALFSDELRDSDRDGLPGKEVPPTGRKIRGEDPARWGIPYFTMLRADGSPGVMDDSGEAAMEDDPSSDRGGNPAAIPGSGPDEQAGPDGQNTAGPDTQVSRGTPPETPAQSGPAAEEPASPGKSPTSDGSPVDTPPQAAQPAQTTPPAQPPQAEVTGGTQAGTATAGSPVQNGGGSGTGDAGRTGAASPEPTGPGAASQEELEAQMRAVMARNGSVEEFAPLWDAWLGNRVQQLLGKNSTPVTAAAAEERAKEELSWKLFHNPGNEGKVAFHGGMVFGGDAGSVVGNTILAAPGLRNPGQPNAAHEPGLPTPKPVIPPNQTAAPDSQPAAANPPGPPPGEPVAPSQQPAAPPGAGVPADPEIKLNLGGEGERPGYIDVNPLTTNNRTREEIMALNPTGGFLQAGAEEIATHFAPNSVSDIQSYRFPGIVITRKAPQIAENIATVLKPGAGVELRSNSPVMEELRGPFEQQGLRITDFEPKVIKAIKPDE